MRKTGKVANFCHGATKKDENNDFDENYRFPRLEGGQTDIKRGPDGNDEFHENDEHVDSLKNSQT